MSMKTGVNAITKVMRITSVLLAALMACLFVYGCAAKGFDLEMLALIAPLATFFLLVGFVGGWVLDKFVE